MQSLAALQTLRPVKTPDYTQRHRTLADARAGQQTEQLRSLQIQGAESDLAAEQAAREKATQIHEVLVRHRGDIEKALPEINQLDPVLGNALATGADTRAKSQLEREKTAREASIENAALREGAVAPEVTTAAPAATAMPYAGQVGAGPTLGGGTQQVDAPLPEEEILGIPSLGVPGTKKRPKSFQEMYRQQQDAARQKQDAELEQIRVREQAQQQYAPPQKITLEEQAAAAWLKQNPGKTLNDYQNMDANRRRQMVNVNLERQREIELENKTNAVAGQIVYAATGRPVPDSALGDAASKRLSDLQSAVGQADTVEKLLANLGSTGAIKGYTLEHGVYWPVVQDNISPEQAEAVAEVQRLANEYIKAVSGAAVSDQEMQRLARTVPGLRLTPEANKKIVGHFKRNANSQLNNYLKLRGWKLKEGDAAPTPTAPAVNADPLGIR